MATENQEIIYKITLDVNSTTEGLNKFTQAASSAEKANKELKDSQSATNEEAKRQETAAKKTKAAVEAEAGSITALREANKILTAQRNATNISTEEGQKKIKALNQALDKNNAAIKDNVDAYTKQKIGVGDYTGALDKLVPGLGATIDGFKGMTTSALSFLATPIGAVIGALGLAVGALTAYFKGSEEGQDKLAKAMAIGKVVMNGVLLVVEKLGGMLSSALEFIGDIGLAMVQKVSPQIGKVLNEAIKAGNDIADLQDKIESEENDFIVRRAETDRQVAEIREQALQLEGDAKRAKIQEAIDLEKSLADAETQHNQDKLKLIDLEIKSSGAATEEQKKQRAEALAAVISSEAEGYQATLRFQKEIEKLKDEAAKAEIERQKKLFEASEVDRAARIASVEKELKDRQDKITFAGKAEADANKSLTTELKGLYDDRDKSFKTMTDSIAQQIKNSTEAQKKAAEYEQQLTNAKIGLAGQLGSTITAIAGKNKELAIAGVVIQKAASIGQIVASTGVANAKAIATSPLTFGMPWVAINTATAGLSIASTIAEGAKAVSQINAFAGGGLSGTKIKTGMGTPIRRSNGDNMLATIKTGEVILNEQQQAALGGDATFRRLGVPGFASGGYSFAQQFATQQAFDNISLDQTNRILLEMLNKQQPPVLVLQDFEAKQTERDQVQTKANVI